MSDLDFEIDENKLVWCRNRQSELKEVIIPEGIKQIGEEAFLDCNSMTSLSIPESVEMIEDYAFSGCFELTELVLPKSMKKVGEHAFEGCFSLKKVVALNPKCKINKNAFFPYTFVANETEIILSSNKTTGKTFTFSIDIKQGDNFVSEFETLINDENRLKKITDVPKEFEQWKEGLTYTDTSICNQSTVSISNLNLICDFLYKVVQEVVEVIGECELNGTYDPSNGDEYAIYCSGSSVDMEMGMV